MELFLRGGFIMWPLLFCSVLGLAIIVDRCVAYWRIRTNYGVFCDELSRRVLSAEAGNVERALAFCRTQSHPVANVARVYLENLDQQDALRVELIKRQGSMELERVEKRLRVLSSISHLAPLMGLLGTVIGMVSAFAQIDMNAGVVQAGDLASGIWKALLTTVFGLTIAIPCMAAFHAFEGYADRVSRQMQFLVTSLDEWLGRVTNVGMPSGSGEETESQMSVLQ